MARFPFMGNLAMLFAQSCQTNAQISSLQNCFMSDGSFFLSGFLPVCCIQILLFFHTMLHQFITGERAIQLNAAKSKRK
ncbi:MAG: hypothetical protein IJV40_13995 [Oscillospiraceae bacterium]|nr:hypothetical protein [Oscillospiraceae bacterium]